MENNKDTLLQNLNELDASKEKQWIRAEQAKALYAHAPVNMLSVVLFSLLLIFALWKVIPQSTLLVWFSLNMTVMLLRFGLIFKYRQASDDSIQTKPWGNMFAIGQLFNGIIWGSAGVWLFAEDSIAHQMVLLIVVAGLVAGAVGSYSGLLRVFLFFSFPAWIPITLQLFAQGGDIYITMGIMACLFLIVMTVTARRIASIAFSSLKFQFQNRNLINDLTNEKDRAEELNRNLKEKITEYESAQEALQESKEDLQTVFENTGTATWIIDEDTTLSMVNSETEKLTGYSKEEVEGKMSWKEIVHKEELDRLEDYHVRRRTEGVDAPSDYEFRLVDTYGKTKDIWVKVALIPGTKRSVASLMDITERKQAEEALRKSEERYRVVIENTGTATSIVEEDRTLSLVNAEFERLTGYSKEEIEGKMTWADFVAPEDVERMKQYHQKRRQQGSDAPTEYEFHLVNKHGAFKSIWNKVALIPGTKRSVASWLDITSLKQAEEALRESEERYRTVMEAAPDPVVVYDMEGEVTYLNPAFTSVFGWTMEESLGHQMDFVPEENLPETIDAVERMLAGETRWSFKTRRMTKDHTLLDIQISTSTILDRDGKPSGSVVILRDITESERMASALKESEERYRSLFEDSIDAIYITTPKGKFIDANQSMLDHFGYSAEEIKALNAQELYDDPNDLIDFLKRIETKGYVRDFEGVLRKKNGARIDCLLNVSVRKANDGMTQEFQGIIRDITERKKAEKALERFRLLMELSPDAVTVYDQDGKATYINRAFEQTYGWSREEVLGKSLDFVPSHEVERTREMVQRTLNGESVLFEAQRFTKDRKLLDVQIKAATFKDSELEGLGPFIVIHRDISELKQIYAELQKAKEAAEDANKAKSDFLASMSHEIRTPMNAIIGMADLLQETSLTPEQQHYVQVFSSAGENLLSIINDILDISKIEAGHLELEAVGFDLTELAETTCDVLAFKAHERGLELACNITPEVPAPLIGDPVRLRQIIMNLIGNAVKFTEQGEVTLEVKKKSLETADPESGDIELLFSVSDTGIGIPPNKIDGIFDSFKQADSSTTRKHGGTGLGLSISKRLVGLMGGRIGAKSEIGKGSTFYFTAKFPTQAAPNEVIEQVPVDLKDLKVLVVDDNATNRTILREMLNRWGAEVSEAENGKIAFEVIKRTAESGDPFKLLLLDSIMPDMNGFQVMQHIKEQLDVSGMTIMMLTSDRRSQDIARCKELGIASYLVKPVKRAELYEAITNALGTKKVVTKEAANKKPAVPEPLPPIHILLVEDNEDNVLLFKSFLKKTPCKLDFAENGRIAVEKFMSGKYDLVLMDMQMPVMDGYTATREIRKWENEKDVIGIPIVALTAYATKEEEQKSLDAGCDAHLTKPIKKARLLEALRALI